MIVIVDYNMGNVGSIRNMLKRLGHDAEISAGPDLISRADRLILPGVGAFDTGMTHIDQMGLRQPLEQAKSQGTPILGICLGMQLLTDCSEEGQLQGLGWVPGRTVKFRFNNPAPSLKIPHMGWNEVHPRHDRTLFADMDPEAGFYFVHSYHVVCRDDAHVLATAYHGYDFCCAVQYGSVAGTQFHPEKSHRHGMTVLRNFVEWTPC